MPVIKNFLLPITGAIVVTYEEGRQDQCVLMTDIWEPGSARKGNLYLEFRCPKDTGAGYIRETFGVEPTVSRIPQSRMKFSRENS